MIEIEVHEIRGECPVYKEGDRIMIDDPTLFLFRKKKTCAKRKTKSISMVKPSFLKKSLLWKSV
jgi:uncharacterized repeat protein (TIGR04076 family)